MRSAVFAALAASLAAAVLLAVAPVAHAQATCADIDQMLHEAASDFADIRGEEKLADLYESTFTAEDAAFCEVDYDWDSVLTCYWRFPSESAATQFIDAQIASLRACLADDAWTEEVLDPAGLPAAWRLIRGSSFEGAGDYADLTLNVRADVGEEGGSEVYEAELELIYLYF